MSEAGSIALANWLLPVAVRFGNITDGQGVMRLEQSGRGVIIRAVWPHGARGRDISWEILNSIIIAGGQALEFEIDRFSIALFEGDDVRR